MERPGGLPERDSIGGAYWSKANPLISRESSGSIKNSPANEKPGPSQRDRPGHFAVGVSASPRVRGSCPWGRDAPLSRTRQQRSALRFIVIRENEVDGCDVGGCIGSFCC